MNFSKKLFSPIIQELEKSCKLPGLITENEFIIYNFLVNKKNNLRAYLESI